MRARILGERQKGGHGGNSNRLLSVSGANHRFPRQSFHLTLVLACFRSRFSARNSRDARCNMAFSNLGTSRVSNPLSLRPNVLRSPEAGQNSSAKQGSRAETLICRRTHSSQIRPNRWVISSRTRLNETMGRKPCKGGNWRLVRKLEVKLARLTRPRYFVHEV